MIFVALVLLLGIFSEAVANVPVSKIADTWMVNIDSLSKEEGLSTSWQPVERHFKAEGKKLSCSFVLGFPYIFANGNAVKLDVPTAFENEIVWTPVQETVEIFEKAFSKKYVLDTNAQILRGSVPTVPEKVSSSEASSSSSAQIQVSSSSAAKASTEKPIVRKNAPAGSREVKNIVIDPGHGGKDPGAIGLITNEKSIVLAVSKLLEKELVSMGFNVKLTRSTDKFIQLSERPQIANKWNGDLFISIHCNAIDGNKDRKEKTKGFRIYVLRDPESEEDRAIARRENKVAKTYGDKNSKEELSPLDWLKIQARLEQYKQASYTFTEKAIKAYEGGKISKMGSGAGGAGFMVLVGAFMPATLIELGFISNPEEERYMNSEKGQKEMAKRIAKGVQQYKEAIDEYLKTLSH